jgi:outer membrane immunogenic protein
MKCKALLLFAALGTISGATVSEAQDYARPFNWTGFYAGAHAGANWTDFKTTNATTPDQSGDGFVGGAQIGYNWQHSGIVLGIETDASFGRVKSSTYDGNFITETTQMDAFGSVRARAGVALGRILPYVTGGLAWAHVKSGQHCPPNASAGFCATNQGFDLYDSYFDTGWVLGGGVEAAITNSISVKVEYLHADFGGRNWNFGTSPKGNPVGPTNVSSSEIDSVRVGVNYRY